MKVAQSLKLGQVDTTREVNLVFETRAQVKKQGRDQPTEKAKRTEDSQQPYQASDIYRAKIIKRDLCKEIFRSFAIELVKQTKAI